jgi:glutathione peroxidase
MDRRTFLVTSILATGLVLPATARAAAPGEVLVFAALEGGELDLAAFRGGPVLVVNTASLCGYTPQFAGLQALWERYRDRGLTVVGVPSPSFRQELGTAAEVRDFCEVNFAIDFPMTELVEVTGPGAHPFFAWAADQGAGPTWNFHKILLDGDGAIAGSFGSAVEPDDPELVLAIEALLPRG